MKINKQLVIAKKLLYFHKIHQSSKRMILIMGLVTEIFWLTDKLSRERGKGNLFSRQLYFQFVSVIQRPQPLGNNCHGADY